MIVDLRPFGKRNVWRLPTGELAVRPGLRLMAEPEGGRRWVGGKSVQNPWTYEVWHYIADVTDAGEDLVVRIFDDNFVEFQSFKTGVDAVPRGFSVVVVDQEVLVCSPDMPTLWGLVGSGLVFAEKVESTNPGTTAIDIPRGIGVSVGNRAVIADGQTIYISDPTAVTGGTIRTFVGQNQNARPGVIFGLHEGAGGSLVAVTSAGTYLLESSAFAVGIVGSNGSDWRLSHHHQAYSHDSSVAVRGRVYALTRRGYTLVDVENNDEVFLDDLLTPRLYGPRVSSPDWRDARMVAGDEGPMVADGDLLCMSDLSDGLRSWWSCDVNATWVVRGALRTLEGTMMLLAEDGIYFIGGNFDGEQTLISALTGQPSGVLFGQVPTPPQDNTTVREISWRCSLGGVGDLAIAVRGQQELVDTPNADTRGLVIGTASWGDEGVYQPAPMARGNDSTNLNFNTGDITVEVAASFPTTRLGPVLELTTSGSAKDRRQDRGAP